MSIQYFEKERIFMLNGKKSTYAFEIQESGAICNLFWGGRINDVIDLPTSEELIRHISTGPFSQVNIDDRQEYRPFGGKSVTDPALKVTFKDGTRNVFLNYVSHKIDKNTLSVTAKDPKYPIEVTLVYRLFEEFDIIERSAVIKNTGDEDFVIENAYSAKYYLPNIDKYRLTYFPGAYYHEFQKTQEIIKNGRRVVETRKGLSGNDAMPFFMIDDTYSEEEFGGVYFGTLIWSGNWKFIFERDQTDRIVITGGINDFDCDICLEGGKTYETPVLAAGYTNGGFGNVTRTLHRYEKEEIIHPSERERILPVIYNTAGSLRNAANEEIVLKEVDMAHEAGIELFVLEGGWTGTEDIDSPTNNGQSHRLGFGTWTVNKKRFPNGLKAISDRVHSYGMKFGLWIEPESVFPLNEIVEKHPDWIVGYDNRDPEIMGIGCYSLNMANDEACEYITNVLINLISENNIDYIKNDFNRANTHLGWRGEMIKHQKEAWDKYVRNMWKCYGTVKERFPDLIFENSAGGGKRTDLGMLKFAGRMHRSDNQDPVDSLRMHEGFTYLLPSKFAGGACFISDLYSQLVNRRVTTMEFQAHVGMMSALSVSLKFAELPEERMKELKRLLALNKEIRQTVQTGEFFRLVSIYDRPYAAYQFSDADRKRSIVFCFSENIEFGKTADFIRLKSLDPDKKYKVTGSGTYYKYHTTSPKYKTEIPEHTKDYGIHTGSGLMNVGIQTSLHGQGNSEILIVTQL